MSSVKLVGTYLNHIWGKIKLDYFPDMVIVNIENSAGGFGVTRKICKEVSSYGVDVFTSGNHIYNNRDIISYFDNFPALIRPANYPEGCPGKGVYVHTCKDNKVAVVNLIGRVFMDSVDCPFQKIDMILADLKKVTKSIIVDFHAEATSEKQAMGHYLDGKVSMVFGTHTHVQTNDARILKDGTGFMADLGMTGSVNSILGMQKDVIIKKFKDHLPARFSVSKEPPYEINGMFFTLDTDTGNTTSIQPIREVFYE